MIACNMTTRLPGRIDHSSRSDVAQHLERLQTGGTVKKCIHLRLDRMPGGYYPKCEHDYASMEPPPYLGADSWPHCPDDCPYYWESLNFRRTVSRDQYMDLSEADIAVMDGKKNPFLKV